MLRASKHSSKSLEDLVFPLFQRRSLRGNVLEVSFPHSAVLFLRHTKTTPDAMKIRINAPGGSLEYEIPVIKLKNYSLQQIFDRNLLFLLPFYLFTHEDSFQVYSADSTSLENLRQEYAHIRNRLEELCSTHAITEYTKCTVIDMTNKVAENLAAGRGERAGASVRYHSVNAECLELLNIPERNRKTGLRPSPGVRPAIKSAPP